MRARVHYAWVIAAVTFVVLLVTAGMSFLTIGRRTFTAAPAAALATV